MKRAIVCILLIATTALAQQPYLETFEVRLHDLEVVVTDKQGNPVRGLTKDDFLVYENDVLQNVTNFSVYDIQAARTSSAIAASNDEQTQSADEQVSAPPPRRFIFFVDDMGVRQRARAALLRDATALVDQIQPGDLVAVVRPTGANRLAQPFTTDIAAARKVLAEAIESCKFKLGSSNQSEVDDFIRGIESARDAGDRAFARMTYEQRIAMRSSQRLGQLRALVASMAGVEGRKVLVVLTSGIASMPGKKPMHFGPPDPLDIQQPLDRPVTEWGQLGDLNPLIDELGRAAAANGVTIYALEPEVPLDLAVQRVTASSRANGTTEGSGHASAKEIVPGDMVGDVSHYRAQTLRSLTERSGGRFFRGIGTIDDVFRQVSSDLSSYYSLAYRATGEEGKVRKVKVSIRNRPELIARTRTEVVDRPREREMSDLVASTLLFPRNVNELGVTLLTGKPEKTKSAIRVPVDVVMPLSSLTFLPTSNDRYEASFDLHYITAGLESEFTQVGRQKQTVEITRQQYEARKGRNYRFKTAVEVWSGPTRIAIGVMDTVSHQVGFKTKDVIAQ